MFSGPRSLLGDVITTGYSTIKKQPEKAATERCEERKTRTIEVGDQNGSARKNSSPVEPSSNRSFLWSISQTKVPSLKVNDEALEEDDIYDDVGCNSEVKQTSTLFKYLDEVISFPYKRSRGMYLLSGSCINCNLNQTIKTTIKLLSQR